MAGATAEVHFLWHRRIDAFRIVATIVVRETSLHFNKCFAYKVNIFFSVRLGSFALVFNEEYHTNRLHCYGPIKQNKS